MLTMKERVAVLESRLQERCASEPREHLLQHKIMALAMEATTLSHDNHELRKVLDEHEFFHVMLQLEYDHVRSCLFHQARGFLFLLVPPVAFLCTASCLTVPSLVMVRFVLPFGYSARQRPTR